MNRKCSAPRRRVSPAKATGVALMIVGTLMFLIFVPRWVWTGALGIVLISVGFLLWRFS